MLCYVWCNEGTKFHISCEIVSDENWDNWLLANEVLNMETLSVYSNVRTRARADRLPRQIEPMIDSRLLHERSKQLPDHDLPDPLIFTTIMSSDGSPLPLWCTGQKGSSEIRIKMEMLSPSTRTFVRQSNINTTTIVTGVRVDSRDTSRTKMVVNHYLSFDHLLLNSLAELAADIRKMQETGEDLYGTGHPRIIFGQ